MNDPMMVPCDHVITRLWEYIDGELTPEHAARIEAHLEICNRCFPQYDFQRAFCVFLRRTQQEDVPPGLRRRVFEMILAEEAKQEPSLPAAPTIPTPPDAAGLRARLATLLGRIFHPR